MIFKLNKKSTFLINDNFMNHKYTIAKPMITRISNSFSKDKQLTTADSNFTAEPSRNTNYSPARRNSFALVYS